MGLRAGLRLLHGHAVHQACRAAGEALVTLRQSVAQSVSQSLPWVAGAALIGLPFVYREPYHLHILILILIWSFAYTSWSMMGRFGLVSLGHGGFIGAAAPSSPRWCYHPPLPPSLRPPHRCTSPP